MRQRGIPALFDTMTKKITVDPNQLTNLLDYAFGFSHEGLHHFDTIYNYSTAMNILGKTTLGSHAFGLYKEYRAYNWMKDMGKDI